MISHTWKRCKIRGKLVLITNRKSYISFRLVPQSVTLNNLERRKGRYIVLFFSEFGKPVFQHNHVDLWRNLCTCLLYLVVRVRCRRKVKFMFAISSPDEFLVLFGSTI